MIKRYLKEIEGEVDKELVEAGLLEIEDGEKFYAFGRCHTKWAIQKRLLKEKYNIDWESPADKNPDIKFD